MRVHCEACDTKISMSPSTSLHVFCLSLFVCMSVFLSFCLPLCFSLFLILFLHHCSFVKATRKTNSMRIRTFLKLPFLRDTCQMYQWLCHGHLAKRQYFILSVETQDDRIKREAKAGIDGESTLTFLCRYFLVSNT